MGSRLHVVGLGPAGLDRMTLGNYRLLRNAHKVLFRTLQHPCAQELLAEGINYETFDDIYTIAGSFEEAYEQMIGRLKTELAKNAEVVYAVPGHPAVAEKTVKLIRDKLSPSIKIVIHPGLSFLDELFQAIPLDPVEGILVSDSDSLKGAGITGKEWVIIPQVYDKMVASNVKLDLMNIYPDEAKVLIVQALGLPEQNVTEAALHEMDHGNFNHLTTVVIPPQEGAVSMSKLVAVMETLRSPGGCPWDREQNHETLKPYLIEETYEVLEAIENQDMYNLCEELGDLLLQVVFHAQVAAESGKFSINDVLKGIIEKLIRRHPHVFGEGKATTAGEVIQTWEQIKREEKSQEDEKPLFFSGPKGLPALMLAARTQRKAAKIGFDWPDITGPWGKVQEELGELQTAIDNQQGIREEFGDLLFAMVNLARFLKFDAEEVLRENVFKFQRRFLRMADLAQETGKILEDISLEEMDIFWEKAKLQEKSGKVTVV